MNEFLRNAYLASRGYEIQKTANISTLGVSNDDEALLQQIAADQANSGKLATSVDITPEYLARAKAAAAEQQAADAAANAKKFPDYDTLALTGNSAARQNVHAQDIADVEEEISGRKSFALQSPTIASLASFGTGAAAGLGAASLASKLSGKDVGDIATAGSALAGAMAGILALRAYKKSEIGDISSRYGDDYNKFREAAGAKAARLPVNTAESTVLEDVGSDVGRGVVRLIS